MKEIIYSETTMELKAEYEVSRDYFWPRKKHEWKAFLWNPWAYWRSYVLKKEILNRFADQIRKDIDARILEEMRPVFQPEKPPAKPITGIVNSEIL